MTGFVWLASYPKSGNTWLRLALYSLLQGGAEVDFRRRLSFAPLAAGRADLDVELDVQAGDLTDDEAEALRPRLYEVQMQQASGRPLYRKVHDAWHLTVRGEPLFPPAVTRQTVYIVRDPRDVAVSLAHHGGWTVDDAIAMMANRQMVFAQTERSQLRQVVQDWGSHVESWLDNSPALLLLRYEDMLAAPQQALGRVAGHLGLTVSEADLARAVAATRFDRLRAEEDRHGFDERSAASDRFFRRGIAGGWRDTLTPAQEQRLVAAHGRVMQRLGYRV